MGEIGNRLREAREARGLTLEQVEDAIRIRRAFLEALEAEQFDKFPADVYARGFLRSYARYLGLDSDPLLKAYRSPHPKSALRLPAVLDEPLRVSAVRNIGAALFWGIAILVIVGLGLWYGYQEFYLGTAWGPRPTPSVIPVETLPVQALATAVGAESEPTEAPTATPLPAATAVPAQGAATSQPSATSFVVGRPSSTPARRGSPTTQVSAASPSVGTTSTSATPRPTLAAPSPEDGIPVVVRISDKTYVNVVVDGTKVMEKILEQGEDQVWAFKRTFSMRVGNAGGVQVTLNGVEMPPLGKPGQVLTVDYSADSLPLN